MKAFLYKGVGEKALVDKSMPTIKAATDVIVKITATTICGTDLHVLKGEVPTLAPGITRVTKASALSKRLVRISGASSPAAAC